MHILLTAVVVFFKARWLALKNKKLPNLKTKPTEILVNLKKNKLFCPFYLVFTSSKSIKTERDLRELELQVGRHRQITCRGDNPTVSIKLKWKRGAAEG